MLSVAYNLDAQSMGFFTLAIDILFLTDCNVIISVQIRCQVHGVLHSSRMVERHDGTTVSGKLQTHIFQRCLFKECCGYPFESA